MRDDLVRVLLVEDDEDDYRLAQALLYQLPGKFEVDWSPTYEAARDWIAEQQHDIYLIDQRLGAHTGLDLIREAVAAGCTAPIILLTGHDDLAVDTEAMKAGAIDYLVKGHMDATTLDRSIRYALERKRFEEVKAERRFRELVQGLDVVIWEARADTWQFSFVNQRAEQILGYPVERWLSEPNFWMNMIHPDDRQRVRESFENAVGEGRDHGLEHRVIAASGRVHWVRDLMYLVKDSQGRARHVRGLMVDITKRKFAENRLAVQYAVTRVLAESTTLTDAAPQILRIVCEYLDWQVGALWRLDRRAGVLRCVDVWRRPTSSAERFEQITRELAFESGIGLPGRVWSTGKPHWISDVVLDGNFPRSPIAAKDGLHAAFGFPIRIGGDILGVIEFFSDEVRESDESLLAMISTLGSQIGQFMDRKEAEAKLRRSEQELTDFFENAAIGLHWVGPDGRVIKANRTELEMLGLEPHEYIGHHMSEFHVDPDVARGMLKALHEGKTLRNLETRLRAKDGSIRYVLIDSNVFWEDGQFVHTRCFTRDISDRKRLEEELRQRAEELAASNRGKDEFLAMLAHELRNPLAAISNASHVLVQMDTRDEQAGHLQTIISRQSDHLSRLVEDLLDVSRISRGKIRLRTEPVELAGAIHSAVEAMMPLVHGRDQELHVDIPDESIWLLVDPTRLEQVLLNLLHNASKYNERGGQIWVRVQRQGEEATISVRDSGVGMTEEMLQRVFEPFTQADRSLDRAQGGLGIGLTLVRNLVSLHGGRVTATSAGLGQGSEFVIHLPVTAAPSSAAAKLEVDKPCERGIRVLVVDDHEDVATSLAMIIELLGHEVQIVHEGPAAIDAVRRFRPDIVLLDIGLPGMNGYEVARKLRSLPEVDRLLLVALSGYGQEEDYRRSREAGFDRHLVKPVALADLEKLFVSADRSAGERALVSAS